LPTRSLRSRDRTRLRRNASFAFLKKPEISWRDFAPDFALKTGTTAAPARSRQSTAFTITLTPATTFDLAAADNTEACAESGPLCA
jgi:hypothetical protein